MGTRISKDIGYFLPDDKISDLLIDDYEETIDSFYNIPSTFIKRMQHEFEEFKKNYPYDLSYFTTVTHFDFMNLLQDNNATINDFIRTIQHHDEQLGLMLLTPSLAKQCRRDNLIDYYEHADSADDYIIKYLKTPIYPSSFYLCVKEPPFSEASDEYHDSISKGSALKKGSVLAANQLDFLMLVSNVDSDRENNEWVYPENKDDKYFHHYVDILCYLFLKTANLFKENIGYLDFIQHLEPAVITTWS